MDLIKGIDHYFISANEGVAPMIAAVYKRLPMSVVNNFYKKFTKLLTPRRESNGAFKN